MDPDSGVYKLVPIANTYQRTIFDTDFESQEGDIIESTATEGKDIPALPDFQNEGEVIDRDFKELDDPADAGTESTEEDESQEEGSEEPGEDLEDITKELLGDDESKNDDYGYEEPKDLGDE